MYKHWYIRFRMFCLPNTGTEASRDLLQSYLFDCAGSDPWFISDPYWSGWWSQMSFMVDFFSHASRHVVTVAYYFRWSAGQTWHTKFEVPGESGRVWEITASILDEVTSKAHNATASLHMSLDTAGHVPVVKNKTKGTVSSKTEEYRQSMKLEAITWLCMSSSKYWLSDRKMEHFQKLIDYILGVHVNATIYAMVLKTSSLILGALHRWKSSTTCITIRQCIYWWVVSRCHGQGTVLRSAHDTIWGVPEIRVPPNHPF